MKMKKRLSEFSYPELQAGGQTNKVGGILEEPGYSCFCTKYMFPDKTISYKNNNCNLGIVIVVNILNG